MNKEQIDNMMRHLPSQREYYGEPLWEKCLAGFSFIAFVVIVCLM